MSVTYDYYRIFYYVGRFGSLTKAAHAMGSSQPNVSRAMINLENELGCRLMHRSRSGISLTPEGERLWRHVRAAFEQIQLGEAELAQERDLLSGTLSVGVSEIALHGLLLPVLRRFRQKNPAVRLQISNHSSPQAVAAVKSGFAELALVTTPTGVRPPLREMTLTPFQEILVGGPAYAALSGKQLGFPDLRDYPLVCLGRDTATFRFFDELFSQHGCVLSPQIEAATTDQILPMVRNDLGLGFIPSWLADDALARGDAVRIDLAEEIPPRHICLVWDKSRPISAAGRVFMDMIRSAGQNKT